MNYELFNLLILLAIAILAIICIFNNIRIQRQFVLIELQFQLLNEHVDQALAISIHNGVNKEQK